jgi:hypothetical protein
MAREVAEIRILNRYTALRQTEVLYPANIVWVGRGSDWGNPFIMHRESQREEVCEKFWKYAHWRLSIEPHWLEPLKGKDLVCVCAPRECHAEILRELANAH